MVVRSRTAFLDRTGHGGTNEILVGLHALLELRYQRPERTVEGLVLPDVRTSPLESGRPLGQLPQAPFGGCGLKRGGLRGAARSRREVAENGGGPGRAGTTGGNGR